MHKLLFQFFLGDAFNANAAQLVNPLTGDTTILGIVDITGIIISSILAIAGSIAVVIILWAAIKFATAQGNDKIISDAKNMILYSVIGLILAFSGFIIVNFVLNQAQQFIGI